MAFPELSKVRQAVLITALCAVITIVLAIKFDFLGSGFSGADESAHFVNSFFFWRFLTDLPLSDPIGYAKEFYISYPKLSIGHWPPFYYLLVGLSFFLFPATPVTAMSINLVLVTAPVFLVAWLILRVATWPWAVMGSLLYMLAPLTYKGFSFFMLDHAVALLCLAAALTWQGYARNPTLGRALLYGALAAAAVLTKGNGWLLGLLPIFHILIGRHWRLIWAPQGYIGALVVAVTAGPWYWLTTQATTEQFDSKAVAHTRSFISMALEFNSDVLAANMTWAGLFLALAGFLLLLRTRPPEAEEPRLANTMASLALATFALHSVLPVGFSDRYMAPALPALIVLAVLGVRALCRLSWVESRVPAAYRAGVAVLLGAVMVWPGISNLNREMPQSDFRMAEVAKQLLARKKLDIAVIDGSTGAEGAFIAEMLSRGKGRKVYNVRSSKLLTHSDFLGRRYKLLVQSPAGVQDRLVGLGADAVVLSRDKGHKGFPHSQLLQKYLMSENGAYRLAFRLDHRYRPGTTYVFVARTPQKPDIERVRQVNFPSRSPIQ